MNEEIIADTLDIFARGGAVFVVLFALSIVATALVLVKAVSFLRLKVGRHAVAEAAARRFLMGDPAGALRLAARDGAPASDVVAHAIRGLARGTVAADLVREDAERVAQEWLMRLSAHMRLLDMIAQIAPLLGLFGTVIGMIETFGAMEATVGAVDPSDLAGGIWVALLTTALGLAIAMPVTAVSVWFDGRIERERAAFESLLTGLFTRRPTEEAATVEAPAPAPVAALGKT